MLVVDQSRPQQVPNGVPKDGPHAGGLRALWKARDEQISLRRHPTVYRCARRGRPHGLSRILPASRQRIRVVPARGCSTPAILSRPRTV